MRPHELFRAATLRSELEPCGLAAFEEPGPFGRTLGAIRLYRKLGLEPGAHGPALEQLAGLICLYTAGVFRGDGEGVAPDPLEAFRSAERPEPG